MADLQAVHSDGFVDPVGYVSPTPTYREFFHAYYGKPVHTESPAGFCVMRMPSEEAARVSAFVNREFYGHPADVEQREDGWHVVVDFRPAIAKIEEEAKRV